MATMTSHTRCSSSAPVPQQQMSRKMSWWTKLQSKRIKPMQTGSKRRLRSSSMYLRDDEPTLSIQDSSSLISESTLSLASLEIQQKRRVVRFESDGEIEQVILLEPNPTRRGLNYSAQDFLRIHNRIGLAVKESRKSNMGHYLDGLRPNLECPKVQERLNKWAVLGQEVRGVEGSVNRRLGVARQRHRTLHVRHIVHLQEVLKRRTTLDAEYEIRRSSENSSFQSTLFAHMMGKADAAAVERPTELLEYTNNKNMKANENVDMDTSPEGKS